MTPTAAELERLAKRGRGRVLDRYEDELTDAIERILVRAGEQAATRFRRKAGSMVAAAPTSRSGMVAVYPAPEEAALLAQAGGEPADILHVTLAFLGEDVDPDVEEQVVGIVREVAAGHGRLEGTVGGVASFGSESAEEPLYPSILLPDVVGLAELRQAVCDALDAAGIEYATNHGWTPHLTLAYTSEPSPPPARLIGQPLSFDALTVAVGDRPRDVELGRSLIADGDEALTSSAGLLPTYELTQGGQAGRTFEEASMVAGHQEASSAEWPSEADLEDPAGDVLYRDETSGVYKLPGGTLIHVSIRGGWFHLHVSAPSRVEAQQTISAFAQAYPPLYRTEEGSGQVPITFWSDGRFGPQSRLRMVDASPWEDVARNYTADVQETLAGMMDGFDPGAAGQLILWQGPPGTGKTWALRALASEWRSWAEFHYITDPDAFFVSNPSYMIDVLLSDSYEELAVIDGETEVVQSDRGGKWRILILEDTGELLAANAKESYGQGLSRLLNVVDGMVGQGLRVLCLVTTNDELGDLHPAVKRPGRCAVQLTFGPLSDEEAAEWAGEEIGAGTIAELYERLDAVELPEASRSEPAFEEESEGMVAAGGPSEWAAPQPDELVDADEIVSQYRGKTDPIRRAAVRDIVGPAVEGVGVNFDATNPFVSAISARAGGQIRYIADTTRLNVSRIVRRSYEEGLSVPDTASAIWQGMTASGLFRARMIARTELMGLANGGTLAAARIVRDATGIPYQKSWMTAPGAKHPRHEDYFFLDGQTRELDDLFDVGGASLDYPGDPAGPAGETVNCRCTLEIVEPEEGFLDSLDPTEELLPEEAFLGEIPGIGSPLPPIRGTTPDQFAVSLVRRAKAMEPGVTAAVEKTAAANGGRLVGRKFRLKGQDSTARKIAADAAERAQTTREAAGEILDTLRYTTIFEEAGYVDGINGMLATLERRGLTVISYRNTWTPGSPYVGVNVTARAANGFRFELQFHTPASYETKQNVNHVLYEKWRLSKHQGERDRLWKQMNRNADAVPRPRRVGGHSYGGLRASASFRASLAGRGVRFGRSP